VSAPLRQWVVNPIALAGTLVGAFAEDNEPVEDSRRLSELFQAAFKADADVVLYGSENTAGVLGTIEKIIANGATAKPWDAYFGVGAVQELSRRIGEAHVRQLLPFIAAVSDASFEPPGSGGASAPPPVIGRYARIGKLEVDGVSWLDPTQGATSDCYLISSMISIAWARPVQWRHRLSSATHGSKDTDSLRIAFFGDTARTRDHSPFEVAPNVPLDPHGKFIYAHASSRTETWPALLERAFVMQLLDRTGVDLTVDDYRRAGSAMFP
jgi:hypothetical protein